MPRNVKVSFKVQGYDEVRRRLKRVGGEGAKEAARKPMSKQQQRFEQTTQRRVAVSTGTLKGKVREYSIKTTRNTILAQIGVNGPQAAVEEFGTKAGTAAAKAVGVRAPRPFIFMHLSESEIDKISDRVLGEIGENIVENF